MVRIYGYSGCSNCRKANRWLADNGIDFESIEVREQPPTIKELKLACDSLGLKKLFNSSGMDYRSLGMKEVLPTLTESEALEILSKNGNLVKRPLVFTSEGVINGFIEKEWAAFINH